MNRSFVRFAFLVLLAASCATSAPAPTAPPAEPPTAPTEPSPGFRLPRDVVPTAYRLKLDARTGLERFKAELEIDVQLAKPRQTIWLDAKGFDVAHAQLTQAGKVIAARLLPPDASGQAAFVLSEPAAAGPATIAISYTAPFGLRNDGFYKVVSEGTPYLFTQFENVSARQAFPSFDEPSFKAPMTLELTVDAQDFAAANTPIVTSEPIAGGKRIRFAPTAPLPTYLYAWTIGPFDVVEAPPIPASAIRPQPLPLRGIATRGHGKQLGFALDEASKLVLAEEAYFGVAFPWPKLDLEAVPDFTAGAMENAGLITFRSAALLLDPATAPLRLRKIVVIDLAHELAHQWFGDLVTLAWWDDVWLNESFATWMEGYITELLHPEFQRALTVAAETSGVMEMDVLASTRKIRQPIASNGDISDAFDPISYTKGSAVISMFERYLGPEVFRAGIHRYLLAHANGVATVDDVLGALSAQSGQDVATPFRTFLDQPGVPLLAGELVCAPEGAKLALTQTRYLPRGSEVKTWGLWQVPVCARYDRDGTPAVACGLLTAASGSVPLPAKKCPAWVQPNADMGGYYRWTLPGPQLAALSHAKLGDLDRFAEAATVGAGYEASVIPAADALTALEPFALDPISEIASAYSEIAAGAIQGLADDSWRPAIRKRVGVVYGPVFKQLGLDPKPHEPNSDITRRARVVQVMAELAEDAPVRAALAKRGRAYLGVGSDGKIHPEAVDPELAGEAVDMALAIDPALVAPTIVRFLAEGDELVRRNLFHALLGQVNPQSAAQVRKLSLDPHTRVNEVGYPYYMQGFDYRTRPAAWADLKLNFDALAARLSDDEKPSMPAMAGEPCDVAAIPDIKATFAGRPPGSERTLAQVVESIQLCAARADAQRSSAKQYFTSKK